VPKRTQSYNAWQLDRLSRPSAAAAFLNAALADSKEMFLVALRKVAQARQMAKVAKEANIQRETAYRALCETGNPTLSTLEAILNAVGMELLIVAKDAPGISGRSPLPQTVAFDETAGTGSVLVDALGKTNVSPVIQANFSLANWAFLTDSSTAGSVTPVMAWGPYMQPEGTHYGREAKYPN